MINLAYNKRSNQLSLTITPKIKSRYENHNISSTTQKTTTPKTFSPQFDRVNFTGTSQQCEKYPKLILSAILKNLRKESEVGNCFKKLITSIQNDETITKSEDFLTLHNLYEKKGFYALLGDLRNPKPSQDARKLIEKANLHSLVLAKKGDTPVMEISSMGRQGLINKLTNSKKAPNDIEIKFFDSANTDISFMVSMNKKAGCKAVQERQTRIKTTNFYAFNGSRESVVSRDENGLTESIYFNPWGKVSFFKSLWLSLTNLL